MGRNKALPTEIISKKCKTCTSMYRRQVEAWRHVEGLSFEKLEERMKEELPAQYHTSKKSLMAHFKNHFNDRSIVEAQLWYDHHKAQEGLQPMNTEPISMTIENLHELSKTIRECSDLRKGVILELKRQLEEKIPRYHPVKDVETGQILGYKEELRAEPNTAMVGLLKTLCDTIDKSTKTRYEIMGDDAGAKEDNEKETMMRILNDLVHTNKTIVEKTLGDEGEDEEFIEVEFEDIPDFGDEEE